MEKTIAFDGYTVAVIKKSYPNGDCLCDIRQELKTEKTDTTDASIQILKTDKDIIFTADKLPFKLTEKQIEFLNPKPTEMKTVMPTPDDGSPTLPPDSPPTVPPLKP